jgi:hypothetical protein
MGETIYFTDDMARARAEIASVGGRTVHVLTSSVLVAEVPDGIALKTCTTARPSELDPASARAVQAWQTSKAKSPAADTKPWDDPDREAPR